MTKLLLLLLFASASAFAQDCKEQNLVTEANSPFQKIPVYDQNGSDTCYAFTGAQMADYHLIKKGAKTRSIHPAWVALQTARRWFNDSLTNGSSAIKSLVSLERFQNCSYDNVAQGLAAWAKKANVTESEILNLIEKYSPVIRELSTEKGALAEADYRYALEVALEEHRSCSANPTWAQLLPLLSELKLLSSPDMLAKLLLPACENGQQPVSLPKAKYEYLADEAAIASKLASKLEKLKSPVALTYCANLWSNPDYKGVIARGPSAPTVLQTCGQHASVVVGKKMIAGTCHFLVRNSWGKEFNSFNEKWTCLCKNRSTGAFVDNCTASMNANKQFDVEGCWIKADAISKNASDLTTLE